MLSTVTYELSKKYADKVVEKATDGVVDKAVDKVMENVYNKTETYNNTEVYNKTEINNMLVGSSYEEITPSNVVSDSANVFENDVLTTVTKEGYTRNLYFGKSYNETLYLSCIVSDMTVPVAIVASDIGADISDCVVVYASRTGTFNKSISFDMGDLSSGANIYINNAATTSATLYRKITNVDIYSKEETDNLLDLKADKITTYTKTEIDNALQYLYKPSNVMINSGSVSNYSNANNLALGQSYFIDRNITYNQMANLPHYGNFAVITTINSVYGNHGKFQLFVDYAGNFSYRFEYGQDGGAIRWSTWHDVADTNYVDSDFIFKKIIPRNLTKIFRRVVCCGDSLTSGHIETDTSQVKSNPKYCWAYYLGLKNNAEYINCGISGASARTWLKKEDGLGKAYAASTTQAYIVAFGMNDSNSNLSSYTPLGTPADIGQDVDTFYCRYGEVIANLHYISPDAYIFLFLMPDENTTRAPYNEAIEYIGENYGASYNLHVVDLRNYKDYFDMQSIMVDYTHYHWTAVGYKQFAEVIDLAISDYILANIQSFQNLNLIDYTLQYEPYGRNEVYTKAETESLIGTAIGNALNASY